MTRRRTRLSLLLCAAAAISPATVRADDAEKITLTGLIDWYYQYNMNHPPAGTNAPLRAFDVKNDSFSLSLLELTASRPATAKNPVGFTATFTLGKTADIVHATEPGGIETYKNIQQLYGTYLMDGKTPVTIDVGKFVTGHGYEVIESSLNDNFSRGYLFTWAIPFYHAGIRITAPLSSQLTGQLMFVNGWNNVEDDNGGKSIGGMLNWKPTSTLNFILNYMGGDERTGAGLAANLNTQLLDVVGIWNVSPKLKLGVNIDYASAAKSGTAGGHWSGWAYYGRYQLNPTSALALRLENFQDSNGLRTGTAQNLNSITATYEHVMKGNLLSRLEFRHDKAGKTLLSAGGNEMDTLTYSQVYKF